MLEIEKRLGRTLEEDYREHYIKEEWGQTKIANRWQVPKGLIFFGNRPTNTPPWTERLGLPVRKQKETVASAVGPKNRTRCEICGADKVIAERADWIANKDGGSKQRFNIIRLCPNHHQLLDGGDPETTEFSKQILLFREAKRIIETGPDGLEIRFEDFALNWTQLAASFLVSRPLHFLTRSRWTSVVTIAHICFLWVTFSVYLHTPAYLRTQAH
jgi:hypothetical protein